MAVKVKLKRDIEHVTGRTESFDHEDDSYEERKDRSLKIHLADGTTKVYREDVWTEVEGKEWESPLPFA